MRRRYSYAEIPAPDSINDDQCKKSFTVKELADEFWALVRTLSRDLDELSGLGVPIYSVQGRGADTDCFAGADLAADQFHGKRGDRHLLRANQQAISSTLLFGDGAATALHKFYHYLPADTKEQIDRLKDRVMIHSPFRAMSSEILQTLMEAIMVRQVVTISYRSSAGSSQRHIQPIGLWQARATGIVRPTVLLKRISDSSESTGSLRQLQ